MIIDPSTPSTRSGTPRAYLEAIEAQEKYTVWQVYWLRSSSLIRLMLNYV